MGVRKKEPARIVPEFHYLSLAAHFENLTLENTCFLSAVSS
jgi:hypothetical protein